MPKPIAIFLLASLVAGPAISAEYHHARIASPPGRHVIEVANAPYAPFSGVFIINGTEFAAKSPRCLPWEAGEQITLLAGDWHGYCVDARFYNVPRHQTCAMWCGPLAGY